MKEGQASMLMLGKPTDIKKYHATIVLCDIFRLYTIFHLAVNYLNSIY
jgi:hypothetical protein